MYTYTVRPIYQISPQAYICTYVYRTYVHIHTCIIIFVWTSIILSHHVLTQNSSKLVTHYLQHRTKNCTSQRVSSHQYKTTMEKTSPLTLLSTWTIKQASLTNTESISLVGRKCLWAHRTSSSVIGINEQKREEGRRMKLEILYHRSRVKLVLSMFRPSMTIPMIACLYVRTLVVTLNTTVISQFNENTWNLVRQRLPPNT